MKKCPNCARAYSDIVSVCPECNIPLNSNAGSGNQPQQRNVQVPPVPPVPQAKPAAKKDSGNILWGILGFLIPIVGVILYFCWKKSRPRTAAVALKGAGIGFFVNMALQFIPV